MGLAFGQAAMPKAAATPEIAALADEITKGIADRKAQAAAIDTWMKKNIRYVAVYLSLGRVVPNDAATILKNKYGDCKDKVTLMAALLAAKGIPSEAALINLGNAYQLPEPATMGALNHVIVYLPDFDLYDDPTVNLAAFGVLAPQAYDKPVIRVSATGAKLARTPPMRPDDHVAHATTTLKVAADGTVTGQTQESNAGIFGLVLRASGSAVQSVGDENAAARALQGYSTPGSGHFDLGNFSATEDPVVTTASFTLNDKFKLPAQGARALISFGLPLTVRPGKLPARQPARRPARLRLSATVADRSRTSRRRSIRSCRRRWQRRPPASSTRRSPIGRRPPSTAGRSGSTVSSPRAFPDRSASRSWRRRSPMI